MWSNIFALITAFLIAFVFFRIAIRTLFKEIVDFVHLKRKGNKTIGKVVKVDVVKDAEGASLFSATLEYNDKNMNKYIYVVKDATQTKPLLGEQVPILYDINDPSKAIINKNSELFFLVFKGTFILIVTVGIFYFIYIKIIQL